MRVRKLITKNDNKKINKQLGKLFDKIKCCNCHLHKLIYTDIRYTGCIENIEWNEKNNNFNYIISNKDVEIINGRIIYTLYFKCTYCDTITEFRLSEKEFNLLFDSIPQCEREVDFNILSKHYRKFLLK